MENLKAKLVAEKLPWWVTFSFRYLPWAILNVLFCSQLVSHEVQFPTTGDDSLVFLSTFSNDTMSFIQLLQESQEEPEGQGKDVAEAAEPVTESGETPMEEQTSAEKTSEEETAGDSEQPEADQKMQEGTCVCQNVSSLIAFLWSERTIRGLKFPHRNLFYHFLAEKKGHKRKHSPSRNREGREGSDRDRHHRCVVLLFNHYISVVW